MGMLKGNEGASKRRSDKPLREAWESHVPAIYRAFNSIVDHLFYTGVLSVTPLVGGGVISSTLIIIGLLKALKAIDLITAIDISLKSLKI
jgi:hypothetical protein